jgi:hypothetical protein
MVANKPPADRQWPMPGHRPNPDPVYPAADPRRPDQDRNPFIPYAPT